MNRNRLAQGFILFFLVLLPLGGHSDDKLSMRTSHDVSILRPTHSEENPSYVLPKEALRALHQHVLATNQIIQQPRSIVKDRIRLVFHYLFMMLALSGGIPILAFFIEYNLVGLHAFCNHFKQCKDYLPRIALIIPAWNEALVLEHTINLLLKMYYPMDALRIYIVDDGSTDNTQEILSNMQLEYPKHIFIVRKEEGGKGKAHTINVGLKVILSDDWAEAIMIIDADISFKRDALRKMARHLADPAVGAVTAYIKEGTRSDNYITRSIGYEYIAAQSMARRAQNVLGVVACLAGGAQLHRRSNIEAMGGQINTSTLAEDTYTTFETQRLGHKVVFEGNAFVYAEEPGTIVSVWKQRFRWGRGNIQITRAFKKVWFRNGKNMRLGSMLFGIIWFCVLLMPIFMIGTSIGLVGLFILDKTLSVSLFSYMASVSLFVYLYTTLFSLIVDRRTSRIAWFEGITYPGIISLVLMLISVNPGFLLYGTHASPHATQALQWSDIVLLFIETWSALCMLWAWLIYRLERAGLSTRITNFLLLIVGYGPLLCAVNLSSFIAELKTPNLKWDKTEKVGPRRVLYPRPDVRVKFDFEASLKRDIQREYRIFFQELFSLAVVIGLFVLFYPHYKF